MKNIINQSILYIFPFYTTQNLIRITLSMSYPCQFSTVKLSCILRVCLYYKIYFLNQYLFESARAPNICSNTNKLILVVIVYIKGVGCVKNIINQSILYIFPFYTTQNLIRITLSMSYPCQFSTVKLSLFQISGTFTLNLILSLIIFLSICFFKL